MAARSPLYYSGGEILTATNLDTIVDQVVRAYGQNPGVTLTVVSSGGDAKFEMTDTRYKAGAVSANDGSYLPAGQTPDIEAIETTASNITETVASNTQPAASSDPRSFPIYYNSSNEIQAMTETDFIDTFIKPALDTIVADNSAGEYFVSTLSSITGATRVSATPIFVDTRADGTLYDDVGITGETLDQPETVNSYYLFQRDAGDTQYGETGWVDLMYIDTDGSLRVYSDAQISALFEDYIAYAAANTVGSRLSYSINGSGTTKGTGMVDTVLDGTSAEGYTEGGIDPNTNLYYAQEFPNGEPTALTTYYLKLTTY